MSLITENQQLNILRDQVIRQQRIVDFHLDGYSVSSDEDFVRVGYEATKNKVLFWLNASLGDVVRSTYASPLVYLLGKPFTEENRVDFEDRLRIEFAENFSDQQIQLSSLILSINTFSRAWVISMTILDNITNRLIPIYLEVTQ